MMPIRFEKRLGCEIDRHLNNVVSNTRLPKERSFPFFLGIHTHRSG